MTDLSPHQELSARLAEERGQLERVRGDYEAVMRSRFHALRMLWFSLKRVFGRSSPKDVYAEWSTGLTPNLTGARSHTGVAALSDAETVLVEAWNGRVAARPMGETPIVSVVIPVFNHRDFTARCLHSIAASWFETLDVQFIVVDDGSTDGTSELLTRLHGIDYVRSGRNEGFVRACNRGAALARGKYVCFLNNDTTVSGGWLEHLVVTAEDAGSIGVVGSKLVFPDGRLQEAGSIIWRDGTGWNVGRNESPDDPRYNFMRDVDYVSGAAMLVRTRLFERLGGFSEIYRPAYYEDVDLCFAVRALGYRVVYQPRSVVVHYDGGSSGDGNGAVKRFQEINRPKFCEKWSAELAQHLENGRENVGAAARSSKKRPTILVVDTYVPLYDREAGSQRIFHVVKLLRQMNYNVVFLPDNYAALQPYTGELQQMGVQVLHHVDGGHGIFEALDMVLPLLDFAWISRPELYRKYAPIVRRNPSVRVIYDTVDLGHVRARRRAEVVGEGDQGWQELQRLEIESAQNANATVVVTPEEKQVLEDLGIGNVFVVPTIHPVAIGGGRSIEETSGLLFIGNYNHPPNVDAVQWLCREVMPLIWQRLPNVSITLVGSNAGPDVFALKSDRVRITGHVPDVGMYFRSSRIFVAPLRFGAGMKGKIGHALQYALPVVTTPVGAEGLSLRDGENAVIAKADPAAFAAAVVDLYADGPRWKRISDAAAATLAPFTPEAVQPQIASLLETLSHLQPA